MLRTRKWRNRGDSIRCDICKTKEEIIMICAIMGEPHVDLDLLEKYCSKIDVNITNKDGTYKSLYDLLMDLSNIANSWKFYFIKNNYIKENTYYG